MLPYDIEPELRLRVAICATDLDLATSPVQLRFTHLSYRC